MERIDFEIQLQIDLTVDVFRNILKTYTTNSSIKAANTNENDVLDKFL